MRNLECSAWLTNPDLKIVREANVVEDSIQSFKLTFTQCDTPCLPSDEEQQQLYR